MTKASDNVYPRFLISEGGSTSTPASGRVTVYAKSDGLLYSKDDAGTEKLLSSGPAAGISSGSANPGSPSTDDQFFRTDLGMLFQYNGTRWLCACPHIVPLTSQEVLQPLTVNAGAGYGALDNGTLDLWIETIVCSTTVITTNDGTKYWTVAFVRDPSATSLGSFNTSADTAGTNARHNVTVGALAGTSDRYWRGTATKTSTPGNIYVLGAAIKFRYVAA